MRKRLFENGKCIIKLFIKLSIKYHVGQLPLGLDQLDPNLVQVEPRDHSFLTSHIFMALCHKCLVIISNDRRHPDIISLDIQTSLCLASQTT